MADQTKRVTIDAPNEATIHAARHLDATEGPVQVGATVTTATRSAIDRVLGYVARAHNSPAATQATDTVTIPAGHCAHCGKPVTGDRVREWNGAASNGPGRVWHPHCHEAEVDADEPDTITDPEWLKQQYAEAIKRAPFEELSSDIASNGPLKITAYVDDLAYAVSLVRDRHLQQLRQRLALADEHQRRATSQPSRPCPACARADQAGLAPAELHDACRENR